MDVLVPSLRPQLWQDHNSWSWEVWGTPSIPSHLRCTLLLVSFPKTVQMTGNWDSSDSAKVLELWWIILAYPKILKGYVVWSAIITWDINSAALCRRQDLRWFSRLRCRVANYIWSITNLQSVFTFCRFCCFDKNCPRKFWINRVK